MTVGNGLPATITFGRLLSITGGVGGGGGGVGVGALAGSSGGVEVRFFLLSESARAARPGNFLFLLSIAAVLLLEAVCSYGWTFGL